MNGPPDTERAPAPLHHPAWWEVTAFVVEAERRLLRAHCLRKEDAGPNGFFRSKPRYWLRELQFVERIESAMEQLGIVPSEEAWHMSWRDVLKDMERRERDERGER